MLPRDTAHRPLERGDLPQRSHRTLAARRTRAQEQGQTPGVDDPRGRHGAHRRSARPGPPLPEGQGFASSSADLAATARAVDNALGLGLPPSRAVGSCAPMSAVWADEGGVVDTVAFNRLPKPFSAADRREYERLRTRLTAAVWPPGGR
ncbi:hypothetical protein DTL70_28535 [Streptomyces diacarni]|uniref:GHMP kinase N-terminal domain-containing protein n=1 Tax=Streptomyces diacarni TaxID=2800381 RepID=A0A367EFB4_9ACTN|nr:hypothetical protein DTL70_28535 [Streptomyces diacarni]